MVWLFLVIVGVECVVVVFFRGIFFFLVFLGCLIFFFV